MQTTVIVIIIVAVVIITAVRRAMEQQQPHQLQACNITPKLERFFLTFNSSSHLTSNKISMNYLYFLDLIFKMTTYIHL